MFPKILFIFIIFVFPIYGQMIESLESSHVIEEEASKLYETIVTFVESSTLPNDFTEHFGNFKQHILELDSLSFRIFDKHLSFAFFDKSQDLLIKSLTQLEVNFTTSNIKKTEILKDFIYHLVDQIEGLTKESENPYFNFLMVSFISYPDLYTRRDPNIFRLELSSLKIFMNLSSGGLMTGSFEDYFKEYCENLISSNISCHFKGIENYFKNAPQAPFISTPIAFIVSDLDSPIVTSNPSLNLLSDFIGYLNLTSKGLLSLQILIQRLSSRESFVSQDYQDILQILYDVQTVLENAISSQDTIHPHDPEYRISEMSSLVKISLKSLLNTAIGLMEKEHLRLSE